MLTDRKIKAARGATKRYRLYDREGLYLQVSPAGGRLWRLKYRLGGIEKVLALGAYPYITLAAARELAGEAKRALRAGLDPGAERKAKQFADAHTPLQSFEGLARDWHARQKPRWSPGHADDVLTLLERLVFPALGAQAIDRITPPMALSVLRAIEATGAIDTARRARQMMSAVFVFAIASGIAQNDPAAIVRGALQHVERRRPMPALLDLAALRAVLRRVEAGPGYPGTQGALRLLALSACRSKEIRHAEWREFEGLDGSEPVWRIPASRMKAGREHVIPLVPQAVAIVEALRPLTGRHRFVFAIARDAPLSPGTMAGLLIRCGYGGIHCAHGFRASFSSIMNERNPDAHDAIEAQLAHIVRGVRGAYMRAPFLERRRELLAEWATLLLDGAPDAPTLLLGPRR